MTVSPLAALGNAADQIVYNGRLLVNQLFCHHQNARNEVGPNIFGVIKNTTASIQLRFCCMRFTDEVSIDCMCGKRAGHVWWRKFDEPYFVNTDALILHQFSNY